MSRIMELGSLEFVDVPVAAGTTDLSGDVVEVAFTKGGHPGAGDWVTAVWAAGDARVLVDAGQLGRGDLDLGPGTWAPFVRVSDNPEQPILRARTYLVIR